MKALVTLIMGERNVGELSVIRMMSHVGIIIINNIETRGVRPKDIVTLGFTIFKMSRKSSLGSTRVIEL